MATDYTKTLNLPSTEFSMRANLPQKEPQYLEKWAEMGVYEELIKKNKGKPAFILHDGPPFSNGNIHMGTALNKILKDFINKYKSMTGNYVPFTPGWDNHGMPIESAIIKKSKLDRKKMSIPEFRNACHEFAQNFVDIQMGQFKRLGVLADWENPYLTMNPSFEAREVKVFGEMYKKGYIYKGLKPVYWCPNDETALAEAEIEYKDDVCTSIYVKFLIENDNGKLADICDLSKTYFIIWTTTTWTLPGNLAIALHPRDSYAVVKASDGNYYIVAEALIENTMSQAGITEYEIVKKMAGNEFEFMTAHHPFIDRSSVVVNAEYVTMDSGTGCVHTAPGFGADDYVTCRRYNIDIIVPVDDRGYQTEEAGKFAGMHYLESNNAILEDMKQSGALFASEEFTHSYPHCWRCKKPIIFRATPQWFCSVDAFKDQAVKACENVEWIPEWGGDRITQMVKERADWCISRQRHWGLPIPVFYCADCGKPVCTEETIEAVSKLFGERGSNAWYELEASEILPKDFKCPHCNGEKFTKETDTLDGWFDSGSTHFAVLEDNPDAKWPADLYLEGADQYRGWFQSSLLTAVGAKGEGAPFKQVLTHGWVVDGEGKAMHKSLGNSIAPEEVIVKYGADLVRLWVASSDYQVDVRVSDPIFKQLSESYRKIRNTIRILMANLSDFNPDTDMVGVSELYEIDKWALYHLNNVVKTVRDAYDNYSFHIVYHELNNFCTVQMSKLYVDITKDRVYTEKATSKARRSAQTTMYIVLNSMLRLLAPVLTFTADEAWSYMPHSKSDDVRHVLFNDIPEYNPEYNFTEIEEHYDRLFEIRDDVMKALELARAEKTIGKSLEAKIRIYTESDEMLSLLNSFGSELPTIFIASQVEVVNGSAPENAYTEEGSLISVEVMKADGEKCDRCWMFTTDGEDVDGSHICARCKSIIEG
ncbi:MAG: isoleucine--tRNA ligase [Ruminococcaceae bacterium]|nr:isoleucine--tRNA ligase [Oscillospiraceae bacterium]